METLTSPPPVETSVSTAPIVSVASRESRWVLGLADWFMSRGATPRTLGLAALGAAALAAALLPVGTLVSSGVGTTALVLAAVCIPLRFVLELVADRMTGPAPEKRAPLFEGVPDLVADALVVVAAGYAASATAAGPVLGWTGALLGLLLAHVRTLAGARRVVPAWGGFGAPMHRMAAITGACVAAALLPYGWSQVVFLFALTAIGSTSGAAVWARIAKS